MIKQPGEELGNDDICVEADGTNIIQGLDQNWRVVDQPRLPLTERSQPPLQCSN